MCGVVYYIQIRKSEQRPPLHLRTADHVPQPRTPRRGGGGGGVYSYSADIIEGPRAPAAGVCSWASRSRETMNMTEQETRGTKQGRHKTGQRRANYPHHSPYLPHSESRAFGLWRICFPLVLVRTGRRLPVQALCERRVLVAVTGYPRGGAPGPG